MKVAIIPFSSLEQSESMPAYRYFKSLGAEITAFYWGDPELPDDIQKVRYEQNKIVDEFEEFDLVVRGPTIRPDQISSAKKITTTNNLFFENCPTKNTIGVTGTKGKGTTSTLIAKILEAAGEKVWLGGNIGRPLLDHKDEIQAEDWIVFEFANFRLIDIEHSPHIGVCLMVVSEHMDWHKDMNEYMEAKSQMFVHQNESDIAVYFAENENSKNIASKSKGTKIPYFANPGAKIEDGNVVIDNHPVCSTGEIKLLGEHNLQNVCAAVTAVWQVTQDVESIKSVLTTFTGLEHRLEFIRELGGVIYYDDSFGTTPETAQVAIEAFEEPKIVILGGSSKGADFTGLAKTVASNNVKHVVLIGDEAEKIKKALLAENFNNFSEGGQTMGEMIAKAKELSSPGDIVLLSTGCASFGLFKNYKDRGEQFKQVVQELS